MTTQEKADLFDDYVIKAREIITKDDFNDAFGGALLLVRKLADSKGYFSTPSMKVDKNVKVEEK